MNERVLATNKTSATPPQATQASSPLLHQNSLTDELSESVGSNSNISKESAGIQPKTIRRSLNWQNISVEAPSRSDGGSLPGGIQRQQEEAGAVNGDRVSGDSAQKSALELSNSTISTGAPAQKPSIARAPLNRRNIPIEAPAKSAVASTYPEGIQRLETSGVKEQEESTDSLQMQPLEEIQTKSSEGEPQEKEEQNKESVQTKLTVGAPGDKHEQEADSMAGKVMAMPEEAVEQPIQRQTQEQEQLPMQPLEEIQAKSSEGEPQEKEEQSKELVQTKLTVGAPGDNYEQEADNMASKVMAMPDSAVGESIQRQTDDEKKEIQTSPLANFITPLVQRAPDRRSSRRTTRISTLNTTSGTVDPVSRTRRSTNRTRELNELGVEPPRRNPQRQPYRRDINGLDLWDGITRLSWGNDFEDSYWQNIPHQLNPQRNNRTEYQCIVGPNNQTRYLPRRGEAQLGEDCATIGHKIQWRDHIVNNASSGTFIVDNDGTKIEAVSKHEAERWYRDLRNLQPEGQMHNSGKAQAYRGDPFHQRYIIE